MTVKIDYESIPRSYRDYLDLMVREGEYLAIDDEVKQLVVFPAVLAGEFSRRQLQCRSESAPVFQCDIHIARAA